MTDSEIESKWQKRWRESRVYETDVPEGQKIFVTAAYPYPNGLMHLGHLGTYLPADFTARYYRMKGHEVLFPMGFHVTGPATTGFAKAIQRGDPDVVEDYNKIHRVSLEDIESFKDPEKIVDYFSAKILDSFHNIGMSIDWRRSFMTKDPPYTKFIEWQFFRLDEDGHLVKGSHPVIWCDSCGNAVGEADRLIGEDVDIVEFFVLKFELEDGTILPAATLRPETVYGVTNMWLKPGGNYRRVKIGAEEWVIGLEALDKLRKQKESVEERGPVEPEEFFGQRCKNPVNGEWVPILPAAFVDTGNATGVVMSVPAHAPIDYQALEDLKNEDDVPSTIDEKSIEGIKPIALIQVDGLGEFPAVEIVREMNISSQREASKLEKATQIIYKKEFYEGSLLQITGKYAGKTVSEAKDLLSRDFMERGILDLFYETTGEVVCRCRNPCHVEVVSDQWFIDYGEGDWKEKTRKLLGGMKVIPGKLRSSFEYYVDWMREKPCARRIGFGTSFPLDPDWIIEPLSDSTIYMAYYTIARIINEEKIDPNSLTIALLDFVFLGIGELELVAESSGLDPGIVNSMRREFLAWYPNDIRFVGPDLVGNHATFFMFNHAAIFPAELWPSGIAVSGIVLSEGQKMSKSKGNSIPITDSLEEWGADIVRLWFAACAEFGQPINYEASLRNSVAKRLAWFRRRIEDQGETGNAHGNRLIDRWLTYRMDKRVELVETHILNISLRKAIQELMFETYNDIQYYRRRTGGDVDSSVLRDVFEKWVLLMTPFAPHFCEEMWERMGKKPFIVLEDWPAVSPDEGGPSAELAERLIKNVIDDVKSIIAATGASYRCLNLYVAEDWKKKLHRLAAQAAIDDNKIQGLISMAMEEPEIRRMGKTAVKFLQQIYPELTRRSEEDNEMLVQTELDEFEILNQAVEYLSSETGMKVVLQRADSPEKDPKGKAPRSFPLKPAIYLE